MRLPRRVLSSQHGVLAFLLLAGFVFSLSAQTPATNSDSLPPKWNEAVTTLAEKIAGASGMPRTLAIEMKNVSSLSSAEASSIESVLEAELKRRGIQIVTSMRAGAEVNITLSEGVQGFVWVAEIVRGDSRKVVMVPASKAFDSAGRENRSGVVLQKSVVWEQPGKFLDFAILPPDAADAPERLLILEADRLAYYLLADGKGTFDRAIAISRFSPVSRDMRQGFISPKAGKVILTGAQCTGELSHPESVTCVLMNPAIKMVIVPAIEIPGQEGDDATEIGLACAGNDVVLATGPGDWTKADWIQAYFASAGQAQATGTPVQMDGPVMSLVGGEESGKARAVVHNLKTGDYEAYSVTATCSH